MQIIEYSVDSLDFIDNSAQLPCLSTSQGISAASAVMKSTGIYRAECNGIIVGSLVTHNTNGTHIGQRCKVLVRVPVSMPALRDLLTVDCICILHDPNFLRRYFADDTDTKTRAREWLTEYQVLRNTKLQTCLADFILEQIAQRLDDFLEIYIHPEVRLRCDEILITADSPPRPLSINVRINGSLYQEIHGADLLCFFFENTDEFFADDLYALLSGSVTPASLS